LLKHLVRDHVIRTAEYPYTLIHLFPTD
jgi:hypothetical protein